MQEAGVPFSQLPPAAIVSTLRKFETKRSSRVYQIIRKSSLSMRFSMERNFLVRGLPCFKQHSLACGTWCLLVQNAACGLCILLIRSLAALISARDDLGSSSTL